MATWKQVLTMNDFLDQDDMSSNSATKVASQQSIKAYVDANAGDTNTDVDVSVSNLETRLSEIDTSTTIGSGSSINITTSGALISTYLLSL